MSGDFPAGSGLGEPIGGGASAALDATSQSILSKLSSGVEIANDLGTPIPATLTNTSFGATQATAANLNAMVVGTGTFQVQNTAPIPQLAATLGVKTSAASASVVLASDQAALSISINSVGGSPILTSQPNGATNRATTVALAGPVSSLDYSSVALTPGASGALPLVASNTGTGTSVGYSINLSAFSAGASGGIIFGLQETSDNGATYRTLWMSELLTAPGKVSFPPLPAIGSRRLAWWTAVNAAITSGTVTVTAQDISGVTIKQGNFFDRGPYTIADQNFTGAAASTFSLTTVGTYTQACLISGYKGLQIFLNVSAVTGIVATAPVIQLQISQDNQNWFNVTSVFITGPMAGAGTWMAFTNAVFGRYARLAVTTAEAGAASYALGYAGIYGTN